jgi:hypothetical protein
VLDLHQGQSNYFKLPIENTKYLESEKSNNWGVWFCQSQDHELYPDIVLINFPLWIISNAIGNNDINKDKYSQILSQVYRVLLTGISSIYLYKLNVNKSKKSLALSDIGNNLIDKTIFSKFNVSDPLEEDLYKVRIRVFTQVLSEWMTQSDLFDNAIISYGKGVRMDLIAKAWDIQAKSTKEELQDFNEAVELRNKNINLIRQLIRKTKDQALLNRLNEAFESLSKSSLSVSIDFLMTRTLIEVISIKLCEKFNLQIKDANLWAYIDRLEKSKIVAPWITSYLHVIRTLANEAAHYKSELERRPELPISRDAIVIHAALNRILSFCIDENL